MRCPRCLPVPEPRLTCAHDRDRGIPALSPVSPLTGRTEK